MQKTINSIKEQSFKSYEVLIIDGNSNDKTKQYLKTLKAPFYYKSENDNGIFDAMNKGILIAKGDWYYFLGAGDFFYNNTILASIFNYQQNSKTDLISGCVEYYGKTKPFIYSKSKNVKTPSWSFFMWVRNGLHHQGTFYKSVLFKNVNYSLKYKILSDYHFNLCLYILKKECDILHETIAVCNSDGVSKSGNWHIYKEEIQLKIEKSSILLLPVFYFIALLKFLMRITVNKSSRLRKEDL